eukprot:2643981-Heterocapsa_arctica.AAC.1
MLRCLEVETTTSCRRRLRTKAVPCGISTKRCTACANPRGGFRSTSRASPRRTAGSTCGRIRNCSATPRAARFL